MATRNNTVPLGQAGTGAAYLLGGSKALESWINQDQQNRKVEAYNNQQQQAYDTNIGASYAKNKVAAPTGNLWRTELQTKVAELNDVGAKYLAQGFDVYNPNFRDPKQVEAYNNFKQDRLVLDNMIAAQKEFEKDADTQSKLRKGDPYAFTPESQESFDNFEKSTSLYDAVSKGIKMPTLEKVFDYNKNITEQIPVMTAETDVLDSSGNFREKTVGANIPAITGFTKNLLNSGPNKIWVEKQIGGPIEGLLQTTDEAEIRKQLDAEFRSPSSLDMMAELKNKGNVPGFGTPEYNKFLDDAVKEQVKGEKAYDKILSNAVQDGIAKANPSYKKVRDFSLERERRAQRAEGRAIASAARTQSRFNEWLDGKKKDKEGDKFIENIAIGNPMAVSELNSHLKEINGSARKVIDQQVIINGKKRLIKDGVIITYPTTVKEYQKLANGQPDYSSTKVDVEKIVRKIIPASSGKNGEIEINGILNKLKSYGAEKTSERLPYGEQSEEDTSNEYE